MMRGPSIDQDRALGRASIMRAALLQSLIRISERNVTSGWPFPPHARNSGDPSCACIIGEQPHFEWAGDAAEGLAMVVVLPLKSGLP